MIDCSGWFPHLTFSQSVGENPTTEEFLLDPELLCGSSPLSYPPPRGVTLAMELLSRDKLSCSSAAASFVSPIWCHLSILLCFVQSEETCSRLQDVWRRHLHENSQNIINFLSVTQQRSSLPPVHETYEVKPFLALLLFVEFHVVVGSFLFRELELDWLS